jgi:hypothetical protein
VHVHLSGVLSVIQTEVTTRPSTHQR